MKTIGKIRHRGKSIAIRAKTEASKPCIRITYPDGTRRLKTSNTVDLEGSKGFFLAYLDSLFGSSTTRNYIRKTTKVKDLANSYFNSPVSVKYPNKVIQRNNNILSTVFPNQDPMELYVDVYNRELAERYIAIRQQTDSPVYKFGKRNKSINSSLLQGRQIFSGMTSLQRHRDLNLPLDNIREYLSVPMLPVSQRDTQFFMIDDIDEIERRVIEHFSDSPHIITFFRIFRYYGLRVSEALEARSSWLNMKDYGSPVLEVKYTEGEFTPKSTRDRFLKIADSFLPELNTSGDGYLIGKGLPYMTRENDVRYKLSSFLSPLIGRNKTNHELRKQAGSEVYHAHSLSHAAEFLGILEKTARTYYLADKPSVLPPMISRMD